MYFVNSQFKSRIDNNVIFRIFPKLNSQQFNLLSQLITETIDIIAIKFNFDLKERHLYEQQFEQNDHRDIKAILQLLLP
jgi:thymidylate synthase